MLKLECFWDILRKVIDSLKEFCMTLCITDLLEQSAARHDHLCPRQVLGVRIGLAGLAALGMESPVNKSTALIIIESDGCFADGVEVATGAQIGHRTLRVNDLGKMAANLCGCEDGARPAHFAGVGCAGSSLVATLRARHAIILRNCWVTKSCRRRNY